MNNSEIFFVCKKMENFAAVPASQLAGKPASQLAGKPVSQLPAKSVSQSASKSIVQLKGRPVSPVPTKRAPLPVKIHTVNNAKSHPTTHATLKRGVINKKLNR
jgi:hypothetical protein